MEEESRPPLKGRAESFSMGHKGYFSVSFERFMRDDAYQDWNSAFTFLGEQITRLCTCVPAEQISVQT
jgi:hypothetical protein